MVIQMINRLVQFSVLVFLLVVIIGSILDDSVHATTIRLQFSGHLTTAGSCQQLSNTHIQCQVPAGTQGQLQLQAIVTPSTRQVSIVAVSLPSWASFIPTSGYGMTSSSCTFTTPAGSAGQTFQLIFRASVPGTTLAGNLTVTLDVTSGGPPSYGPYDGVTDGSGRISILIPWMGDTYIVGTLIECSGQILAYTPVSVTLVPKEIDGSISSIQDIGSVIVSSSGYGDVTVDNLTYASSMDLLGKTSGTVQLGYFCLVPTGGEPGTTITGVTDANGDFSLSLTSLQTTIEGRLIFSLGPVEENTTQDFYPLVFSLTLVPKSYTIASATDIAGFTFSVCGYLPTTITQFSMFSIFGLTSYSLGEISLTAVSTERDVATLATVFDVPFVAPDTSDPIDGVIGADWKDGLRSEIQIGDYPAILHARHDGVNVFLAIELFDVNAALPPDDLTFCFVFDNGDGELFGDGDDQIRVPVSGDLLYDGIDYVGDVYGEAILDAQQDAVGCARRSVDAEGVRYVIEISRPIDSGDEFDVFLIPCMEIPFSLGFATTTACGRKTETVSRSTIHLIPQPTEPQPSSATKRP